MKTNQYQLPTFWWVNPWAHARYLIDASEKLGDLLLASAEKQDKLTS